MLLRIRERDVHASPLSLTNGVSRMSAVAELRSTTRGVSGRSGNGVATLAMPSDNSTPDT